MSVRSRLVPALFLAVALPVAGQAVDAVYTSTFSSLAVSGHDPVAYFRVGRPVEGSSEHEVSWQGATWRFASAENRQAFLDDPEAFAPQYGGHCAWAMAQGQTAPGNAENWKIVDGKLYLNVNDSIQARWEKDIPGFIERADRHWPKLLAEG